MNMIPRISLFFLGVFLIGSGYIMYAERPVMNMEDSGAIIDLTKGSVDTVLAEGNAPSDADSVSADRQPSDGYSLAIVEQHGTKDNCWVAINGSVYNLTDWVSRHPGGEGAIVRLCGTDGTEMFEKKHGSAKKPAQMLVLFRIGSLFGSVIN
jgi:cytochrome b involved in lipid metabolism